MNFVTFCVSFMYNIKTGIVTNQVLHHKYFPVTDQRCFYCRCFLCTVEPLYNGHHRDPENV